MTKATNQVINRGRLCWGRRATARPKLPWLGTLPYHCCRLDGSQAYISVLGWACGVHHIMALMEPIWADWQLSRAINATLWDAPTKQRQSSWTLDRSSCIRKLCSAALSKSSRRHATSESLLTTRCTDAAHRCFRVVKPKLLTCGLHHHRSLRPHLQPFSVVPCLVHRPHTLQIWRRITTASSFLSV